MSEVRDILIRELCLKCPRRGNVCKDEQPSFVDAYRCKYAEAGKLLDQLAMAFPAAGAVSLPPVDNTVGNVSKN